MKNSWAFTCSIIGLLKLPILVLQLCQRLPASSTVSVGVHALLQTLQHAADRAECEQLVVAKQLLCCSAEMAYRAVLPLRSNSAELVTPHPLASQTQSVVLHGLGGPLQEREHNDHIKCEFDTAACSLDHHWSCLGYKTSIPDTGVPLLFPCTVSTGIATAANKQWAPQASCAAAWTR